MSFTGAFTTQQSISDVIVTDTSSGTDGTITTRRIYFQRSDGSYLVPDGTTTDYVEWPLSDGATITVPLFTGTNARDYALNITVNWITPTPTTGNVYTLTQAELFRYFTMTFLYGLTQEQQVARPKIVSWNSYLANKFLMFCYMLEAINAIELAGDTVNAQACLNAAYNMISKQSQYF